MTRHACGAALAALLAAPAPAFAWGAVGHRVVARVAYDRLSEQAKQGVDAALGRNGLERVAACPDAIDHEKGTVDCGPFRVQADPSSKPWHYIDLHIGDAIDAASLSTHCPGDQCIVAQIRRHGAIAMSTTGKDRQVALMYLVHLIADLHQPLHCGGDHDAGGNRKSVLFEGNTANLHALWDHLISAESWREQQQREVGPLVSELEADLTRRDVSGWTAGDLTAQAALESFAIARDTIYPRYYEDARKRVTVPLDDQYRADMEPIVNERLEKAAVRLAAVLERLFGPRPPKAPPMDLHLAEQAVSAALGYSSSL